MATSISHEDCQGNAQRGYRASRTDDSGRCVMAQGVTEAQAEREVEGKLKARNTFLKLPAKEQLCLIVSTDGDLLSGAMSDAIKLLANIVLSEQP